MRPLSTRRTLLLGLGLLAAANGIALAGAAWNRGAEDSRMRLSEREFSRPYTWRSDEDDSTLWLELDYEVASMPHSFHGVFDFGSSRWNRVDWLDARKLAALGFDVTPPPIPFGKDFEYAQRSREAFAVLEFNGPAYARRLDQLAEAAKQRDAETLQNASAKRSRLIAIDVGTDAEALRARYRDRGRYAIMPAVVDLDWELRDSRLQLVGRLRLLATRIHLDASQARALGVRLRNRVENGVPNDPPFELELAFGRKREPWIVGARPTQAPR